MRYALRTPLVVAAALAAAAVPANVMPWGEPGHLISGAAAAAALPVDMPQFFRDASGDLTYLNPEPDRWRDSYELGLDRAVNAQALDHYVDFEWVPADAFKTSRYEYLAALKAGGRNEVVGFLPYRIIELTQRVRIEFRLWRAATDPALKKRIEARIVNDAGILGHYVADGSNPHHTTIHHNGWVGENPKGYATDNRMHARFESIYVQSHMALADVQPLVAPAPRVFADVRQATLEYLNTTHGLLDALYDLDKKEAFDDRTQSADHKRFVAERLGAGATMLRDLWWTAWVTSSQGAPPRGPRSTPPGE
jgi:hypothetical protein